MWFFYFFLFWSGFRLAIRSTGHHEFGESSILSMQYTGETLLATKLGNTHGPGNITAPPKVDAYIDSRGVLVHGKRPT
jgi:hypothetical protein